MDADLCLRGARLVLPDRVVAGHDLLVGGGRILTVAPSGTVGSASARVVELEGAYLGPGFVDLHCHAGGGSWFHDDPAAAASHHLAHGTTSMLATTILMTSHRENVAAVATIADAAASGRTPNVVGIHMEGPYLNPDFGAYRERSRLAAPEEYLEFVGAGRGLLRWMTIAPEVDGVPELVHGLQAATAGAMTFSVGHSRASAAQIEALVPAGLTMATHLFNATGCSVDPTRYAGTREAGVDEAVLVSDGIVAEVIADRAGRHVRPELLRLALRAKGAEGIVLVTDASAADGAPTDGGINDGEVSDVRFNAAGGLAGSALTMDAAVANLMRHTGVGLAVAWRVASRTPASCLGLLGEIGQLLPGRRANLVAARYEADAGLRVERVWLDGQERMAAG